MLSHVVSANAGQKDAEPAAKKVKLSDDADNETTGGLSEMLKQKVTEVCRILSVCISCVCNTTVISNTFYALKVRAVKKTDILTLKYGNNPKIDIS